MKDFLLCIPHTSGDIVQPFLTYSSPLFPFLQRDEAPIKYMTLVTFGPFLHLSLLCIPYTEGNVGWEKFQKWVDVMKKR